MTSKLPKLLFNTLLKVTSSKNCSHNFCEMTLQLLATSRLVNLGIVHISTAIPCPFKTALIDCPKIHVSVSVDFIIESAYAYVLTTDLASFTSNVKSLVLCCSLA